MSEQAIDDIRAITDRLASGMFLRIDRGAFPRFFGYGQAGKEACNTFAKEEGCIALLKEENGEFSVEFMRAYPKRETNA